MTTFALIGTYGSREIMLSWEDGQLSGDAEGVTHVKELAAQAEGRSLWTAGYIGPLHHHLQDPYQAYQLMKMIFRQHPQMIGELPPLPQPPEGAVGL